MRVARIWARALVRRAPLLVLLVAAASAHAADVEWSLRILNRLNYQKDMVETQLVFDVSERRFRTEDYLLPSVDHLFSTHVVGGFVDVLLGSGWSFTAAADSGVLRAGEQNSTDTVRFIVPPRRVVTSVLTTTRTEVALTSNGFPVSDEFARSLFLREAYFTYVPSPTLGVTVGKRRFVLADGFLFDQFTFGAALHVDGKKAAVPVRFDFDVLVADGSFDTGGKASPLVHVGLNYVPGPFQHLGFNFIFFHDGNDLLSQVFDTLVTESNLERSATFGQGGRTAVLALQAPAGSSGNLAWFGLSGRRFFGDHTIAGAVYGQYGRLTASALLPPAVPGNAATVREFNAQALGILTDLFYQYDVTERFVAGGFFTFATGDAALTDAFRARGTVPSSFGAFLSIFPFVTRTNLFFNGGLNAEFTARKASTLGVNARGLVTAGAFARYEGARVSLEAKAAALGAHEPSIYDGRYYGTEIDLSMRVRLAHPLNLVVEADTLLTGDFFATQRGILQLILGLDVAL